MQTKKVRFGNKSVDYHFESSINDLKGLVPKQKTIIITDANVLALHQKKLAGWKTIVLKAGEEFKVQATVDEVINQLIELKADRQTTLVGVGGGVVTDITGYVASVFLRGVAFGFVPTTLLAMVDASIGGKNGIDVGDYKNMVGTINQPNFLLFDTALLKTLPDVQWQNGFAEIIKHAAIKDAAMFKELENHSLDFYQKNKSDLVKLVRRNVLLKTKVVQDDEFEKGERRLLNFGHTLGHALEKQQRLLHGEAIAIGMTFAGGLSTGITGFKHVAKLVLLLEKYGLPTSLGYDKKRVFKILSGDKKKIDSDIHFILLEKVGKAVIKKIPLLQLYKLL